MRAGYDGDEPAARAAIGDDDPSVRGSGLASLVRLGAATEADFAASLGDPDSSVRVRALRLLVGGTVRPDLARHLPDPDDSVTETAAFVAGELYGAPATAPVEVVAALSRIATDHADALCRESAVAALGAIGDPAGLGAVLAACRDRATVRRRAVLALAAFDGPEVESMLAALRDDRDTQVRQAAEDLS